MPRRQSHELLAPCVEERIGRDCKRGDPLLRDDLKCCGDLTIIARTEDPDLEVEGRRRRL